MLGADWILMIQSKQSHNFQLDRVSDRCQRSEEWTKEGRKERLPLSEQKYEFLCMLTKQ